MTADLIRYLRDQRVFDPSPNANAIGRLHVPFDAMLRTTDYEHQLAATQQRGERVALVGATGCGKTSILEHVFSIEGVANTAPVHIRVGLEVEPVATDPSAFLKHVLRTFGHEVQRSIAVSADEQRTAKTAARSPGRQSDARQTQFAVGGGLPWLHAELARQLNEPTSAEPPTAAEVIEHIRLVLDIIGSVGLRPVLILDDTDHWVQRPGEPSPDQTISRFFGEVVRVVSECFPMTAAIVPVHESYLTHPAFVEARAFLPIEIALPTLPDPAALAMIVDRRIQFILGGAQSPGIVEPNALDLLHATYVNGDRRVRSAMLMLHAALTSASDDGSASVALQHVERAID